MQDHKEKCLEDVHHKFDRLPKVGGQLINTFVD